jgi:tRNA (guanine37-N1)-methyltransferase
LRESLGRTWLRRPDLLANRELDFAQRTLLDEYIREREQIRTGTRSDAAAD